MIIVDIETSGLDPQRHGMLSLGAVDYNTGIEFYGECSLGVHTLVDDKALEVNGFKREDIQPGMRPQAEELYWEFFRWSKQFPDKLLAGHNFGSFDLLFLKRYHNALPGEPWPFGYKTIDLHSVAYAVLGQSLSHSDICRALGLTPEPKPHHALYGACSERDAFRALLGQVEQWKFTASEVEMYGVDYDSE